MLKSEGIKSCIRVGEYCIKAHILDLESKGSNTRLRIV